MLNTNEMLTALAASGNEACRSIATRILSGQSTITEERKYTGSFMSAVLDGDYKEAVQNTDAFNIKAFYEYLSKDGLPEVTDFMLIADRMAVLGIWPTIKITTE